VLKKAREGNNWRMRFVVIRDNFLFYFKSDSDLKAEPRGVIRLDDAQAYFSENPTRAQDSLKGSSFLCVESPNYGHQKENGDAKHGGKSLFYLSGTIGELQQWKEMVDKAAGWWTRKSSLNEMRRRASSAANAVSQPTVPKISAAAR
jgi:hypothetical protein